MIQIVIQTISRIWGRYREPLILLFLTGVYFNLLALIIRYASSLKLVEIITIAAFLSIPVALGLAVYMYDRIKPESPAEPISETDAQKLDKLFKHFEDSGGKL